MRSFFSLLLITSIFSSISCVGKKKFLNEVSKRTACDSTLQALNKHNLSLNSEIAQLKLEIAEKTGEGNALREIKEKQDKQIDRLEKEIKQLTNQSLNQQQSLDGALKQKEQELQSKKADIQSFKDAITAQEKDLNELIGKVASNLSNYSQEELSLEVKNDVGFIRLSDQLLFRKGTQRLSSSAYDVLESIARVLLEYPQMDVLVLGHTDNQPVRDRRLKDNWDLSVLQATPVVRMLTDEFGLNPNQVTAGGKGESKPKASNDTPTGREQNRRTEIVIYPPFDKILKRIMDYE